MAHELDDLDSDLQLPPDNPRMAPSLLHPPRRDGMALGFGLAFIVFGIVGLLKAGGADVPSTWLYPIILIGLGAAGLASAMSRRSR